MTRSQSLSKFFSFLYGERKGYVEVRQLVPMGMATSFYEWPNTEKYLLEDISTCDKDAFMGVLLRKDDSSGKSENCEENVHILWADIDKKNGSSFTDILTTILPVPNVIVDSGHGWHLYWKLSMPVTHALAQRLMEGIADVLAGDRVGDPARILRIPTTINHKDGDEIPVRILRFNVNYASKPSDFVLDTEPTLRIERLVHKTTGTSGTRSEELFFVAIDGLLKGKSEDDIYEDMLNHPAGSKLQEMNGEHRRRRWLHLTLKNARRHISQQRRDLTR